MQNPHVLYTQFPLLTSCVRKVHVLQLMNQYLCIAVNQRPYFIQILSFYLMSFYCSRIPSKIPHSIYFSCFFWHLLAVTVSQTCLVLDEFDRFEEYQNSTEVGDAPLLKSVICFSHSYLGCGFLGRRPESKVPFSSHPVQSTYYQHDLSLFMSPLI